ncbi:MAG: hypothetical protein ACRDDY_18975 [Clostridium sp.]|uniref:hypothetical protein n=1 Tax=Clostridium sp. TaxID=1506 RepID=UPI003EE776DF
MNLEEFICDICKNDYIRMFTLENIVAIGLGKKIMNGFEMDSSCMHVYVKEKTTRVSNCSKYYDS